MAEVIIPKPGSIYNESFAIGSDDKPYRMVNQLWIPISLENVIDTIDCSTNPNCPVATKNQKFRVIKAGYFGGIDGPQVEVNDLIICIVENNSEGTWAEKGANFFILQANIQQKNLEELIQKTEFNTINVPVENESISVIDKESNFKGISTNKVSLYNVNSADFLNLSQNNNIELEIRGGFLNSLRPVKVEELFIGDDGTGNAKCIINVKTIETLFGTTYNLLINKDTELIGKLKAYALEAQAASISNELETNTIKYSIRKNPFESIIAHPGGGYDGATAITNGKEIVKINICDNEGDSAVLPPLQNSDCGIQNGRVIKMIIFNKGIAALTLYAYNNLKIIDTIDGIASVSIPAGKYIELIGYSVTETLGAWETLRTDII